MLVAKSRLKGKGSGECWMIDPDTFEAKVVVSLGEEGKEFLSLRRSAQEEPIEVGRGIDFDRGPGNGR